MTSTSKYGKTIMTLTAIVFVFLVISSPASAALQNPLGDVCNNIPGTQCIQIIIGRIIQAALGLAGSIALLMFIYGGFLWLTSGGSPEKIEKGKNTLLWAVLGIVLIFGAYTFVNFVLTQLTAK